MLFTETNETSTGHLYSLFFVFAADAKLHLINVENEDIVIYEM